jgi:threonine synthase
VFSALTHLECSRTGERYQADRLQGTSSLGAPLLARYDLEQMAATLACEEIAGRAPTLWRHHELLPVRSAERVVSLGERMTPLVPLPVFGRRVGVPGLLMKDEGLIPTGTFKARGRRSGSRAPLSWVSPVPRCRPMEMPVPGRSMPPAPEFAV